MEPLVKQLQELPKKLYASSGRTKAILAAVLVAMVGVIALVVTQTGADGYQYAFTNLTGEDGSEAALVLKTSQIPYRLEAGGTALAVPANRVYEARLLLATAGLPHASGTGFELFDRGDLGVSEFTQQINLRRATEGELARTVSRLNGVRSARVHLTLPERGLFRNDKASATAAVVLNLQPGKQLGDRELAGVRHLIASAVPSLDAKNVTIVDGQGSVLGAQDSWGEGAAGFQAKLEKDLEARVVGILEPVVGVGQVVARVSATVDASEVNTTSENFDPDTTALKTERIANGNQQQENAGRGQVAGAAANQPLQPVANNGAAGGSKGSSSTSDETRNYEVSKVTTHSVARAPRLTRLSVAVLLDGKDGKPRDDAEVARLGELARRAVGLDAARGDKLDISSSVFTHSMEEAVTPEPTGPQLPKVAVLVGAAIALLVLLAGIAFFALRKKSPDVARVPALQLKPGMNVAQIEAAQAALKDDLAALPNPVNERAALPDPAISLRDKARTLAAADPAKTAHLLRAWISGDVSEVKEVARG